MAILSSFAIIRGLCLFHITLAWYLLSAPRIVAEQNLVVLFGEAMRIPEPTQFLKPNSASAFSAIILAFLGLSDLIAVSMDEEIAFPYWANNIPLRLMFLLGLTGYTYAFKPSSGQSLFTHGVGDPLKNRLVFTWGFFECTIWFWAYVTLRDEKAKFAERLLERRKREAELLRDA
ncbi:putative increased loss of mitochondrial dna protein 1 [Diplodia seriata]|uniref:Increased loss of mitochondrial DNA protein 1 n=2 Tax=Diplodia TaxID=66735 RepID=A0ABR3TG36_9PEZI|nr:putative increased loss of mitochondrial dna protein 1 [Diplodia seriata]